MNSTTDSKYRILLLGDYSNMHSQLGRTLAAMGHDVTVMSDGSGFQQTVRDIDVSRPFKGKLGGLLLTLRCRWGLYRYMRGYDIVAVQNPHFLALRPERLRYFFDRLRRDNGAVFLTAAGTDAVYLQEALNPDSLLKYNEFRVGSQPSPFALARPDYIRGWLRPDVIDYDEYVYRSVDGIVSAIYEYDVAARRFDTPLFYGGIPIDTDAITPFHPVSADDGINLFLGRHRDRIAEKGTDLLEQAARTVAARHPGRVKLEIVENHPYEEYIGLMSRSHVVLDQIYSYTPATNALIAMARGLPVVSGGEEAYYDFIGETSNRPIVNASPVLDTLIETLDTLVADPASLAARGASSREFVLRHNSASVVANRFLKAWEACLETKK